MFVDKSPEVAIMSDMSNLLLALAVLFGVIGYIVHFRKAARASEQQTGDYDLRLHQVREALDDLSEHMTKAIEGLSARLAEVEAHVPPKPRRLSGLPIAQQLQVSAAANLVTLTGEYITFNPKVESLIDEPISWDKIRLALTFSGQGGWEPLFVDLPAGTVGSRETPWRTSGSELGCRVRVPPDLLRALQATNDNGSHRFGDTCRVTLAFKAFQPRGEDLLLVKDGRSSTATLCLPPGVA
jgi:hypothetical protein